MPRNPNTNSRGERFDQATVERVWAKARIVQGYDSNNYRADACNVWIQKNAYGDANSKYGWEVDHVKPVAKGGADDLSNLQPLHWQNNRHKGDDWPGWSCAIGSK
jgi:5-methylcytosine-specific restriction endonuclease McrA